MSTANQYFDVDAAMAWYKDREAAPTKRHRSTHRAPINARPVVALRVEDDSFVARYPSIKNASEQTGICYDNIKCVLGNRRQRHAGGYKWVYETDYQQQQKAAGNE